MRVLAREVDYASCPSNVAMYVNPEQAHVTRDKEYVVHAVAVFGGIAILQVVDDLGYPSWKPSWLFSVSERRLPDDWICSLFPDDDPQLILGPGFVAQDQATYARMVELDVDQVRLFWDRLDARKEDAG